MTTRARDKRDARDLPNYPLTEAARWLGLVQNTLRAWFVGQNDPHRAGQQCFRSVLEPASSKPLSLSFWNLVECSVLSSIRNEHGVSMQKVRKALSHVAKEMGKPRPLIEQVFMTDGVHLFVDRFGQLVSASEHGQSTLRRLIEASLQRIERDADGLAARLFPWSHRPTEPRVVSVDPRVSFGRPVLAATSIPVESILSRFRAGERIEELATDYQVSEASIQDLVRWALEPAAA